MTMQILFGERLEILMSDEKVSKRKLSLNTGVDRKSIGSYLRGICLPRFDALAKIADFFEVSVDYMLGLEEESIYCYKTTCQTNAIPNVFVGRLKELMLEKKLSQGKLAKKLNMQQASISKWIRFRTMPETAVFIELARVFDCTVDYLIGRSKS